AREGAEGERGERRPVPHQGLPGKGGPTSQKRGDRRRRQETASKIGGNLPTGDERELVALEARTGRDEREEPPQDLPVATHPAVLAPRVREHARGIVIDHLEVGDERRARVESLEEIVRQQGILGHAVLESRD